MCYNIGNGKQKRKEGIKMKLFDLAIREDCRSIVQIKGDLRCVLGEDVYYRLYEIRRGPVKTYAINVSCGRESEIFSFGSDRLEVLTIYRKIVRGAVTPTTLKDIAEDYLREKRMLRW